MKQNRKIKWMNSMVQKHGTVEAVREFMRENGRIGGITTYSINPETGKALKGFAVSGNPVEQGRKGGKISRKTKRARN